MKATDILLLEQHALNAWPAAFVQNLDGWLLRYTYGVTGRGNSVWPNHNDGRIPLNQKLTTVEAFYRQRELPPRFMMTDIAKPSQLFQALHTRGYQPSPPVAVQIATPVDIIRLTHTPSPTYTLETSPSWHPDWGNCYAEYAAKNAHEAKTRQGIIQRINSPTCFVTARTAQKEVVAIGLGVFERGWVGIFCMVTVPHARRQGIASAILNVIAQWGIKHNAHLYLQVSTNNPGAVALYHKLGFNTAYQYHHHILHE